MNPMRQDSGSLVWNLHVVITNLCGFVIPSDLPTLRLVNHACNYAVLLFMKQNGRRPTIHLRTDDDISSFLAVMSKRTNQELPAFCSYKLALASTSLHRVEQFASKSSALFEIEFIDKHRGSTGGLALLEDNSPAVLDQQIASGQFCSKILSVLKKGSTQLQKISIGCKRDIPLDQTKLNEFPQNFPNLREVKARYLSHGFQMTNDMVSTIVSRAPRLQLLKVTNFVGQNRWIHDSLFLPRLAQILNRANPPFLKLNTRLTLQHDMDSLETLMRVAKFNRLRVFEFMLIFEEVNQDGGGNLLKRFSKFLKFQAPALQELVVLAGGSEVTHPLQLPELPNLKNLQIVTDSDFKKSAVQSLMPNQFPNLESLVISGHNLYKNFVGSNVLPSVKTLVLALDTSNASPVEDATSTNTVHINFPNLTTLVLCNTTFKNLKRVDYVLNYLENLEVLVLSTNMSLKHRGGNAFWKTFAGKHKRLPKRAILKLCQREPKEPLVREERDAVSVKSYHKLPSLGNLRKLKILAISVSLATQLAALAYMARPQCMCKLEQLHLRFTHGNSIGPEDEFDYVRMLRRFHHEVTVVQLGPPPRRGIRI